VIAKSNNSKIEVEKSKVENIIIKYVNNEASAEEITILRDVIKSEEYRELLESYLRTDYLLDKEYNSFDSNIALEKFIKQTKKEKNLTISWTKKSRTLLKYAAILVIGVFATVTFYLNTKIDSKSGNEITLELEDGTIKTLKEGYIQNIINSDGAILGKQDNEKLIYQNVGNGKNSGTTENELVYNKLYIPFGKKFQIELSDGSVVYLNSGSTLKYPVKFLTGKSREVFLEGEAYFKVSKDKNDSFIVYANELNTKVYGTEFNISAYESDNNTHVVLVEGSVAVWNSTPIGDKAVEKMLKPLEKAELNKNLQEITIKPVNVEKYIAWKEGVLMFENEKFETIILKLERHFNVSITNNFVDLNENRYTGVFDVETLDEILIAFSNHKSFEYKKIKDQIIINQ